MTEKNKRQRLTYDFSLAEGKEFSETGLSRKFLSDIFSANFLSFPKHQGRCVLIAIFEQPVFTIPIVTSKLSSSTILLKLYLRHLRTDK